MHPSPSPHPRDRGRLRADADLDVEQRCEQNARSLGSFALAERSHSRSRRRYRGDGVRSATSVAADILSWPIRGCASPARSASLIGARDARKSYPAIRECSLLSLHSRRRLAWLAIGAEARTISTWLAELFRAFCKSGSIPLEARLQTIDRPRSRRLPPHSASRYRSTDLALETVFSALGAQDFVGSNP